MGQSIEVEGSLETYFEDFEFSFANAVAYHPNSGRWGCIEMDKFYVELAPGANTILRDAKMSTVTIPDIPSFNYIKEKTDAAIAAGSESSGLEEYARGCGIPDRLLLPKGKENGLEMALMAFLEDGEADKADDFTIDVNNEFGGTHAHCGIHGQKVPDKRAMGYPLDRPILDFRMTASIPNFKTNLVKVYHKPSE